MGAAAGRLRLPPRWDELVASSADVDRFCSGAAWATACHGAFNGRGPALTASAAGAAVALAGAGGGWRTRTLCGLDRMWGFACPVVGPDVAEGAALLADLLRRAEGRWDAALLPGLVPGSPREVALLHRLARRYRIAEGPAMTRRVADLSGGAGPWLTRRGAHFRRNLRRAVRAAGTAGLTSEGVSGGVELVERAVAVDVRSWKGARGSGLAEPAMANFYRLLAAALGPAGNLRARFARLDGRDVGFILGAVTGDTYRGFQLAHDTAVADLSVGNLLQWQQIETLAEDGIARYDLGMDMPYKQAWADEGVTTRTLAVLADRT